MSNLITYVFKRAVLRSILWSLDKYTLPILILVIRVSLDSKIYPHAQVSWWSYVCDACAQSNTHRSGGRATCDTRRHPFVSTSKEPTQTWKVCQERRSYVQNATIDTYSVLHKRHVSLIRLLEVSALLFYLVMILCNVSVLIFNLSTYFISIYKIKTLSK